MRPKVYFWSHFLNLNDKIFRSKRYCFHFNIQTDGIDCSLLFVLHELANEKRGSSLVKSKEEGDFPSVENLPDNHRQYYLDETKVNLVGCDPGKRSLVYLVDSTGKKLQYTAPQRKFESTAKRSQLILEEEKEKCGILSEEALLSKENSKTTDYFKFKKYIYEKNKLNYITQSFYNRPTWRKMKMRRFIYGKKSVDKFISKIGKTFGLNGRQVVIGYGNWSQTKQMKHYMPTLGKGLRKLIHRKYCTFTVNEAYTSRRCTDCLRDLNKYVGKVKNFKTKKVEVTKIHRLLVCSGCVSSENKKITFKSRDINAAINILKLTRYYLLYNCRPVEFCKRN